MTPPELRRYVVLLYDDEASWPNATPEERRVIIDQHANFPQVASEYGVAITGGEALQSSDTATVFRRRGDDVDITDGPFAETAEQLGGFYLVDAPDLDRVLKAIATLPEYTCEVRPIDPNPGAT